MIKYENAYEVFKSRLGPIVDKLDYVGKDNDFLAHPAISQLLPMLASSISDERGKLILALVTDLVCNGDEKVQELVDVSFFEVMHVLDSEQIEAIYYAFEKDIRVRIKDALQRFDVYQSSFSF